MQRYLSLAPKEVTVNHTLAVLACVSVLGLVAFADDPPELPKPEKQHAWLEQLAGEWDTEMETSEGSGQTKKHKGTESARMIGGFWLQCQVKADMGGTTFTGILTVGYDPAKKIYVGTWIDSMTSFMWRYEGTVDEAGKVLTLNTEGPSPMDPKKTCKFREVLAITDADHKTFTSHFEHDGKWVEMMKATYTRKK